MTSLPARVMNAALPFIDVDGVEQRTSCKDGLLRSSDVARIAGVSTKAVRRAVDAYCATHDDAENGLTGAVIGFSASEMPDPQTQTRAQMARFIAERIGIGRFGLKKKIEERAARRPPKKPKGEKRVSTTHPWTTGRHGRHVNRGEGGVVATLTCSRCPTTEAITFRLLADSDVMDRKFAQKGWATDPARCPAHNRRNHQPRKDPAPMTETATFASPTPAAIAAQAKMFGLLQTHFDPDAGTYSGGYSDQKIAEECRLAVDLVAGVRKQAFGDLKVPAEVGQLLADIAALESLLSESVEPIRSELASLKRRVTECCKKFGG